MFAPGPIEAAAPTLILGFGNPWMGDDGAGMRVAELLANRELPAAVKVEQAGTPGWDLPMWFEGCSDVILVDAVQMGQKPGEWKCFQSGEIQVEMEDGLLSLHQPDLACGLALSQALGLLPGNLRLYGIQPGDLSPGAGLSPAVCACLPEIIESIISDLEKSKI
jgi:hydrogenase maturation protease